MKLFRCVVEDNKDPEYLGRVRIRVQGVHSPKLSDIKTDELPWSEVMGPIDAGNTLGSSTNVLVGTWGYCMSLNDSFTEFVFMGTTKGIFKEVVSKIGEDEIGFRDPDGVFPIRLNEPDNPLTYGKKQNPDITQDRVQVDTFIEPKDTAKNAVYPNNKVYEDHNGNIVEIDGTPDNSRIRIQHSTGARVEINTKGDVTIQASKTGNVYQQTPGLFSIGADGGLIIQGDVKINGSVEAAGEVSDLLGNLSSLRASHDANVALYNSHTHVDPQGGAVAPTTNVGLPDPLVKYIWSGSPL